MNTPIPPKCLSIVIKDVTPSMIRLDQTSPEDRLHVSPSDSFLDPGRSVPLDMCRPISDNLEPDRSVSSGLVFREEPDEEEDEDDDQGGGEEDGDDDEEDGDGYSE